MIHEGPLLEYAGRDLAYLQWAAAARHWIVLVIGAQIFLPHAHGAWWQLAVLPVALVVLCGALALVETLVAKMRILLAPRLLAVGALVALLGIARASGGYAVSGAVTWALVALGLGVVVIRRRSVGVGFLTVQALALVGVALDEATTGADVIAAVALATRAVALAALFLLLVARTREPRPVRAGVAPLGRAGVAIALALVLTWLVPTIGLVTRDAERAVLALVAFGIATTATRRATLFQVMGVVLVENGLALAALKLPGVSSLAIGSASRST